MCQVGENPGIERPKRAILVPPTSPPSRSLCRVSVALCLAVLTLLAALTMLGQNQALARSGPNSPVGPAVTAHVSSTVGTPLPRIVCLEGYTATVYAEGLESPDGLAFDSTGLLYVAEERAGQVSQIGPTGGVTPVITGLTNPEGIAFDDTGNLYVVEDIPAGRLVKRTSAGLTTTLATDLEAPEGVVWTPNGMLYVTESSIEGATEPADLRTRIAAISASGIVSRVITNTPEINGTSVTFWSYAGLTVGPEGLLFVTNELSGIEETVVVTPGALTFTLFTTDSVFTVDPATGVRTPFANDLVAPEGLRFSTAGRFPLYVAEEDTGGGNGRLSRIDSDGSHVPFCTGFFGIEDVAVKQEELYVSEDTSGLVILIKPAHHAKVYTTTIEKSVDPASQVSQSHELTYTLVISAVPGTQLGLYDPLTGTAFLRFLRQPTGIFSGNHVVTGTFAVTPSNQVTVSFVSRVNVAFSAGQVITIANRACIYPLGGTLGACVWSNKVSIPVFQPYRICLPLVIRDS